MANFGQPGNRVNVQAAHDAFSVRLDGGARDAEFARNFLITLPFGDEHEHLALATG